MIVIPADHLRGVQHCLEQGKAAQLRLRLRQDLSHSSVNEGLPWAGFSLGLFLLSTSFRQGGWARSAGAQ